MPLVSSGQSVSIWIYSLLLTSLQLWGRVSPSTSLPALPNPFLQVSSRSGDSVVLVCRAPVGYRGVRFALYRVKQEVDSKEDQRGTAEAQFTVEVKGGSSAQQDLYCCHYKNQNGTYSAFSSYLTLDRQQGEVPTPAAPSFPSPVLSVEPSSGHVKRGQMLSFHCSVPSPEPQSRSRSQPQPQSQSQSQSQSQPKAMTFLLMKTAGVTGETFMVLRPQATQASNSQQGAFSVGPVRGGEGGSYTCFYQVSRKRALLNSTVSNMVQVTITDLLPSPTLVLQQQAGVWHLLCTGSAAYPGGAFTLYQDGNKLPVAAHRAPATHHEALFPVPVQDPPSGHYQCQYSILLGREWSTSERSLPLTVSKGLSPSSPVLSGVDWPLVLGCSAAVVLFLSTLILVVVVVYRKVQAAARETKKREEAQFWTKVHAKDHVVDLTLGRSSISSQEWANEDRTTQTASRSPLWNPLSTFTSPTFH
ncbi:immunoglobulin superfamily member 1 [Polymixia lowei]